MNHFSSIRNARPEDELLFVCTRQQFLPAHGHSLSQILRDRPIRWQEVYSTAVAHGVAPLVYLNLSKCPEIIAQVPQQVRKQFARCTRNSSLVKAVFADRARDILTFFASHSVPVMLIKGFALNATVYREPWYTLSADIDLMIRRRREDFPDVDREAAYKLEIGRSPLERRIAVEYGWFEHHDVTMDGLLPVDFDAIWNQARPIEFLGWMVLVMSAEHLLLTACINSCRKRFFRLKALCDISEIMLTQKIDWSEFVRVARQWRCEIIAYTALQAVAMTLGCAIPNSVLDELGVPSLRRRLIQFLGRRLSFSTLADLNGGNRFLGRRLGAGLLLPFAVYNSGQLCSNLQFVWRKNG
jgi:hypothetical protein